MDVASRARQLALAGIEVRATQADAGGGGGKTAHEPAGSPKGGQFTHRPGGGGSKATHRRPTKTAAAPQNVPQAPATPRLVKEGDSGEDVRYAQYAMSLLGFNVAQDGRFGPETAAAVKQMQQRLGMKHPNGHITAALLHKMQDAVRLSPCVGGQRDLSLEAQWERRDDGLEDDDLGFDEIAEAVLDAIDEFERSTGAEWDERKFNPAQPRDYHGRWSLTAAVIKALKGQGGEQGHAVFDDGRYFDWSDYDPATQTHTLEIGDSDGVAQFHLGDYEMEQFFSALTVTKLRDSTPSPRGTDDQSVAVTSLATLGQADHIVFDDGSYIDWSTRTAAGDYGFGVEDSNGDSVEFDLTPAEFAKLIASLALSTQTHEAVRAKAYRTGGAEWDERGGHDVSKELRIPSGKGGGRWTKNPVTSAIAHALEEWTKGNGPDDPFTFDGKPIDREPLRKAAVARGISLKRGASREDIVAALKDDLKVKVADAKAAKSPAAGKPVRFTLKGKDHRNRDVGVFHENGKIALWEVSDSGERRKRVALVDDLAGLESWANEHGESELAGWARKERGAGDGLDNLHVGALGDLAREHGIDAPNPARESDRESLLKKLRSAGITAPADEPGPAKPTGPRNLEDADVALLQSATKPAGLRRRPEMTGAGRQHNGRIDDLRREGYVKKEVGSDHYSLTDKGREELARKERGGAEVPKAPTKRAPAKKATKAAPTVAPVSGRDLLAVPGSAESAARQVLDGAKAYRTPRQAGDGIPVADPGLSAIAHMQGFDGPPKVVSAEEMDRLYANGSVKLTRGVGRYADETSGGRYGAKGKTPLQIQEDLRTGPAFFGQGNGGSGYHFAAGSDQAAEAAQYGDPAVPGAIVRATLAPDAKIATFEELHRGGYDQLRERHGWQGIGSVDWNPDAAGSDVEAAFGNMGRYAAARGYDAYWVIPDHELAVVNRTKLIVEAGPSPTPAKPHAVTPTAAPDVNALRTLDTEARRDALDLRKVDELKSLLREQGLPVSGRKRDLVDRLVGHLETAQPGTARVDVAHHLDEMARLINRPALPTEAGSSSPHDPLDARNAAKLRQIAIGLRDGTLSDAAARDQLREMAKDYPRSSSGDNLEGWANALDRLVGHLEGDGKPVAPNVRPSGLPTDRKLVSGDFDDLAARLIGKNEQQILDLLADLNASELARLALKYEGARKARSTLSTARGAKSGLRFPDDVTSADARRLWLAQKLVSDRKTHGAWRSVDPGEDEIERAEETDLDEAEEGAEPTLDQIRAMAEPDRPGTEARARELALLGVTRALGHDVTPGHDELHHYWTRGEGLAKWAESPKPWTTLVAHLTKYVGPEKAKVFASRWFIEVFHFAAGSDLNRVTHGHPPRGHRVGPG